MALLHHCTELLFLLCGISEFVMCQNCFGDPVQHDKYMEHQVFRKLASPSLYDCVSECLTSSVCLAFAFEHKTLTCFLNSNNSAQVGISPRSGFDFRDIQQWTKRVDGHYDLPCGPQSKFSVLALITPNTAKSYELDKRADADLTFHARFRVGRLRDKIVINSKIRDRWGYELPRDFKIKVGMESHIQISLHNGVYKLIVDDVVMEFPES